MPSLNPNTRRPPPPLPGGDPNPPPVPNRPSAQKPSSHTANNPPSPPIEAPPALPQRPSRNNIPPPPPELEPFEQEDYEDINTPTIISLPPPRHQPAAPPSQFSGAHSGDEAEADDCYVMPAQDDDECDYTAPDPVTPEILPIKSTKQSKGMPMLNSADLQMRRLNLSSSSLPEPKSSPAAKEKNGLGVINTVSKMLQEKVRSDKDKPPPPPKPKKSGGGATFTPPTAGKPGALNKAHTTDVSAPKTLESPTTTNDKKKRDSGDNSSAGSFSSLKEAHKKKDLPALPTSSTTKEKQFKLNAEPSTSTSPMKPTRVPEPQPEAEQIYDDGVSVSENLSVYDWFHDDIDRKEADRRIQSIGKVGTFLIRTSSGNNKAPDGNRYPYTLVVQTKAEVKNLRIRQRADNKYAIGTNERADEICFPQLYELVDHHRKNNVKVFQKNDDQANESVKLIFTPKKT